MPARTDRLTDQELEIMKVVWEHDAITVRDVYETLLQHRQVAYTTVMTMMKILEQKGFVTRTESEDRAYLYKPTRPRDQVLGGMVREFINRVFNGSAEPLLLHIAEDRNISERDLKQIAKLLRKKQ